MWPFAKKGVRCLCPGQIISVRVGAARTRITVKSDCCARRYFVKKTKLKPGDKVRRGKRLG